jgi:hypothetical protein
VATYGTIAEALRCGGDTLAVDAVLLIGEHGYRRRRRSRHYSVCTTLYLL